jgi:hypothetical protein
MKMALVSKDVVLVAGLVLAACQGAERSIPKPAQSAATLTEQDCLDNVNANGKIAVCMITGSGSYNRVVVSEQACVRAFVDNNPENFADTTGDCSCVGTGQGW